MAKNSKKHTKTPLQSFAETIESLVVAFILAFIFRAFIVEAFVIPTGSMADTLRGAHYHLTCPECGYIYNYSFNPAEHINPRTNKPYYDSQVPKDELSPWPNAFKTISGPPHCPMCGKPTSQQERLKVNNGDRILVLKYLYQFHEPDIWDAIVFKNPVEPKINYIKRLIGKPGQKIEIIDGDIYVDDTIQTKPYHVQDELWIESYNHDFQPLTMDYLSERAQQRRWQIPFDTLPGSPDVWQTDRPDHRVAFDGSDQLSILNFNPYRLAYTLAEFNAYNGAVKEGRIYLKENNTLAYYPSSHSSGRPANLVSDLKLSFLLKPTDIDTNLLITLGKYGRNYYAIINADGDCSITNEDGQALASMQIDPLSPNDYTPVSFAVVDHQLRLSVGNNQTVYHGPNNAQEWGYQPDWQASPVPVVQIGGKGKPFTLEKLILYRDIHYSRFLSTQPGLATEGHPIQLHDNQYFVLGDNSPISGDSRFWSRPGIGNNKQYAIGTVPREYLIGKAYFVYWPAGYSVNKKFPINLIPNFGEVRFIH